MGKQSGWSGSSCASFVAWLLMHLERDEDYVIVENVSAFPADELQMLMKTKFDMRTLLLNPHDTGFPINRRRQYMLLLNKSRWRFKQGLDDDRACQEVYRRLFQTDCHVTAEDLCRASSDVVYAHREECAVNRGLTRKRRRGEASLLVTCCLSGKPETHA